MFLNPIPGAVLLLGAASTPTAQKVTHARFLVLIVGVMVVFLGALALLTVVRMLRRRTAARFERDAVARASGGTSAPPSAWHTAGQRATPVPARSPSPREEEEGDDDVDDGSGEFPPLDDTDFGDDGADDDDDDDNAGPPGRFG